MLLQSGTSLPGFSIFTRRLNSLHGIVTYSHYTVAVGKSGSLYGTGLPIPADAAAGNVFSPLFSFPLSKSAGLGSACLPALFLFPGMAAKWIWASRLYPCLFAAFPFSGLSKERFHFCALLHYIRKAACFLSQALCKHPGAVYKRRRGVDLLYSKRIIVHRFLQIHASSCP